MQRRNLLLAAPALLGTAAFPTLAKDAPAPAGVLRFGLSASLSGGQAEYGKDIRDGVLAAFAAAGRSVPDRGVRFELVTLDDGGDRERCKANVRNLIGSGVQALVGLTSGAAAEACLPIVEEAQIVMLGCASGNMGIRSDKLSMPFHVRAGYDSEYRQMVGYIKNFGMKRVGYVHLKDTSPANSAAMTAALDAVGVKITADVPVDRNSKSFNVEADSLLAARLDSVLFTTNAAPVQAIIERMAAAHYPGTYFSSSFAGQSLIKGMASKGISIIMSQVVPRPNSVVSAVVKHCQDDLAALGTGTPVGYTSLEGYIAGRVAVEAARAAVATGGMSRARFRAALSDLNLDLGGYRVRYGAGSHQGSNFVDIVALDRNGRIIG
jgi:ABC-type branched-subunit amino acid transport system substrate-binding protein